MLDLGHYVKRKRSATLFHFYFYSSSEKKDDESECVKEPKDTVQGKTKRL